MKQKIAFAFLMGIVTTGLVSFTVVSVNPGFTENFTKIFLKSWVIAYVIVIPVILMVAPQIERLVGFFSLNKKPLAAARKLFKTQIWRENENTIRKN